jgi:alpha-N-arabinofuranosidase
MILTPTYHVFDMYKVHQDAMMIPVSLATDSIITDEGKIPAISISSSIDKDGKIHITLCNLSTTENKNLNCSINSFTVRSAAGQILTSDKLNAHNTFDSPSNINIQPFDDFKLSDHSIEINIPKHSVIALEVIGDLNLKSPEVDYNKLKPGLIFNYYKGDFQRLPDFYEITPFRSGNINNIVYPEGTASTNFGLTFNGYIKIEKDGLYEFYLTSDDGSKLSVNNEDVVMNDGLHGMVEKPGALFLKNGYHKIDISFFQRGGGSGLKLMIKAPDKEKEGIKDEILFHLEN